MSQLITCGYCRESFEEDRAQPTCGACPLSSGCRFVRCPSCGFENPSTPAWLERLRGWLQTAERARNDEEAFNRTALQ